MQAQFEKKASQQIRQIYIYIYILYIVDIICAAMVSQQNELSFIPESIIYRYSWHSFGRGNKVWHRVDKGYNWCLLCMHATFSWSRDASHGIDTLATHLTFEPRTKSVATILLKQVMELFMAGWGVICLVMVTCRCISLTPRLLGYGVVDYARRRLAARVVNDD